MKAQGIRDEATVSASVKRRRSAIPVAKALSLIVAATVLRARWMPLPHVEESQTAQVLTPVGILAWPSVPVPWLPGRFTFRARCAMGIAGVILGYWVQGQPLFALTYERLLFNTRLVPYLIGSARPKRSMQRRT